MEHTFLNGKKRANHADVTIPIFPNDHPDQVAMLAL